ncbi:MAG: hypothetical protein WEB88_01385 [Gemmatimonadota bacterium]
MLKHWLTGAALAAALFVPHHALHAQAPISLKTVPRVGWFAPLATLDEGMEMGSGPAVGVALELDMPMLPLNFRVNMDLAPDIALRNAQGSEVTSGSVLAVVGDLVFRPAPTIAFARPYLLTGFGMRRYEFGPPTDPEMLDAVTPPTGSDFTFHAGVGVDVGDGPVALVVELSDYLSSWNGPEGSASSVQNDLFVSLGIRLGIF